MAIKDLFTLGRQGQAVNSANGEFVVVGNQNEIVVRNNKNQIVSTTELQGARPYGNYQVAAISNDAKKAYITTWNGYLTTSGAGGVFEVDLGSGRTKRLDVDKNNSTFTYGHLEKREFS
jgi:hypothetical protein